MAAELKPCPFCGDDAETDSHDSNGATFTRCCQCGATVNGDLENWNTRAKADSNWQPPPGWKLVPVEPTEAMLEAGSQTLGSGKVGELLARHYRAMVAAAPEPLK